MVSKADGLSLKSRLPIAVSADNKGTPTCDNIHNFPTTSLSPANLHREYAYSSNSRYYGPNNLAEFSSLGPAFDGRMKPDIVAPGVNIMSANSDANMCARALQATATILLVSVAM
jgi:hypothetical protein